MTTHSRSKHKNDLLRPNYIHKNVFLRAILRGKYVFVRGKCMESVCYYVGQL